MNATDERRLLRAVAGPRDGAWMCDVREAIPVASELRVRVGLSCLVAEGLVVERQGAFGMATFALTFAGVRRLRSREPSVRSPYPRRPRVAA